MLLVRLTASDLKIVDRARLPEEFAGVVELVRDRIKQSQILKEFGKTPTLKAPSYTWQDALKVFREVLGQTAVTIPPYPESRWYQKINTALKHHGNDDASIRQIAEYVRQKIVRKSYSFDFMVCQQMRILAGEFDTAPVVKPVTAESMVADHARLPED